jgi:uncharacterized protein (TIGR03086 family)
MRKTVGMDHSDHMARGVEVAVAAIRGADPRRFGDPTPCSDYTVETLLHHLAFGLLLAQLGAERRDLDPSITDYEHAPYLVGAPEPDWAALAAAQGAATAAAWAEPAAWEGEASFMGNAMPAAAIGSMMTTEFVLHGWDLATATGQPFAVSEDLAAAALEGVRAIAPTGREAGWFAAAVELPAGASTLERVLAASGRDPSWRG